MNTTDLTGLDKKPLIIGLTGGIGCGKSTVEACFRKLGIPVIDADTITKTISEPGGLAYPQLKHLLSDDFFLESGLIDRKHLRQIAFDHPDLLSKMEIIIHPLVYQQLSEFYSTQDRDCDYIIASIPLLLETKMQDSVDRILVIDCTQQQQIDRVMARDNLTSESIDRIINKQINREERLLATDDVLDNTGDLQNLYQQVEKLHQLYTELASK